MGGRERSCVLRPRTKAALLNPNAFHIPRILSGGKRMNGRKKQDEKMSNKNHLSLWGNRIYYLKVEKNLLGLAYVIPHSAPFHISYSLHRKKAFNSLIA